jgi:leucyl aminopeptidase
MKIKVKSSKADVRVDFLTKSTKNEPIGFTGKMGEIQLQYNRIVVGTKGIKDGEDWRELGVKVVQFIKSIKVKSAYIDLPEKCGEFVEGLQLGDYEFNKYKSNPKKSTLKTIYVGSEYEISDTIRESIEKADATCLTRDWVNTTPEDANSFTIEQAVKKMFKGTLIDVEVYEESFLREKGMNAHLAVNRASRHKAITIKLTYEPKKYSKHHVFVGKGLTYDSGGLSIKPGNHMTTMKADKAGAMTVWGMMKYLSDNKSPNKVTAYLGIAENMINGTAYKPDDVLTAMNGKTIHIKNTDAEGRLVLFDNLCLAQHQNKDIDTIHTLATLTGAAVYCFGDEAAGLVSYNDKLKKRVQKAGEKAGEVFMDAAFHRYMMDGVDDTLADLSNTGSANMGCQKAGLFLTNAITKKNKQKYIHWDIAGPAFVPKAFGHNPSDATGFGVRTLIEFIK